MDFLNPFGTPRHKYQGVGILSMKEDGITDSRKAVSFEVRQLEDGQIVVGYLTRGHSDLLNPYRLSGTVHQPPQRNLSASGLRFVRSNSSPAISWGVALADTVILKGAFAIQKQPTQVVFSIVNFTFGQTASGPGPLELASSKHMLTISAVPNYAEVFETLRRVSGVRVTAFCAVKPLRAPSRRLSYAIGIVGDLCDLLSLVSGTKVAWTSYQTDSEVWCHRSSVTRPYSHTVTAYGWRLNLLQAMAAWHKAKEKRYLASMIDYFVDASARGPYLETRALTAASLLDGLANRYATEHGRDVIVDEAPWVAARPKLRQAIRQTCKSLGLPAKLAANVNGLRRYMFRTKLEQLLSDLKLVTPDLDWLISVRDRLVHDGSLPDGEEGTKAYRLLLNTDYAILARLAGYFDTIPGQEPSSNDW